MLDKEAKKVKILITGSSGFIGSALKSFLESREVEIVDCDLKSSPSDDIRNYRNLSSKMKGIDGIVHLAAISRVKHCQANPQLCMETNVEGTVNLLEALCNLPQGKRPWIIFASSREVFGKPDFLPAIEESPKKPINIYGTSKFIGEGLCWACSRNYDLKVRVLRFANVYTGRNDRLDRVVPNFIIRAIKDKDLVINGNGEEIFDFIYIEDVVLGIWCCIKEVEKSNEPYNDFNLATGRPTSLRELAEIVMEETRSKGEITHLPSSPYEVDRFFGDPRKAKKILGFEARVSLYEGIKLATEEFKRVDLTQFE